MNSKLELTNDYNLPGPLYRALCFDGYDKGSKPSNISTTSLIGSPLIFQLKKRHGKKVVEDASSRVWSLLGQAVHVIAERAEDKDSLSEERFYMDIDGWTISGQIDIYEHGKLSDIKVTSVFAFQLEEKEDWQNQMSVNSALLRHAGFEVTAVEIAAIVKDWSRRKAEFDISYPQVPIIVKPMGLWPNEKVMEYIRQRVKLHQEAEKLPDDEIPICTPAERWARGESWAIMADKAKRATAVLYSEETANERMVVLAEKNPKKKFRIEYRPAEDTKCLHFCPCAKYCRYGKHVIADKFGQ